MKRDRCRPCRKPYATILGHRWFITMEDGVILSQLINTKQVVRLSLGLAISMALSSLILWKGSWLASPIQSPYDEHGVGIFVGLLTCVASFVWSFASPASLRTFLERVFPPIMIVALLASRLFIAPMGFVALDTIIGFVIPAVGTYLFVFAWFSVIAAHNVEDSLLSILLAWPFTVALRAFFGLFEAEIVKFALSMLLICAAWLLLIGQSKRIEVGLPMVVNMPRENKNSYIHALGSIWKCALYCGAFAFLGGVIRSLSLQIVAMNYINYASILGGLLSALAIVAIWRVKTVRYSISHVFQVLFPLLVLLVCALPFFDMKAFFWPAAALYMVYSFMLLSMQVLCVQITHDYGVSPSFCISFQTGVSVCMQGLGYLLGNAVNSEPFSQIPPLATIALISLAMLALVVYFTRGLFISQETDGRSVEFLSLARKPHQAEAPFDETEIVADDETADVAADEGPAAGDEEPAAGHESDLSYVGNLSARCEAIGEEYYLSQREIEVMQLFMQGYTMSSIAKELFISENTVKTHTRRLYSKLGINKKQQLFNLVNGRTE